MLHRCPRKGLPLANPGIRCEKHFIAAGHVFTPPTGNLEMVLGLVPHAIDLTGIYSWSAEYQGVGWQKI
jgi:hypothetical protein